MPVQTPPYSGNEVWIPTPLFNRWRSLGYSGPQYVSEPVFAQLVEQYQNASQQNQDSGNTGGVVVIGGGGSSGGGGGSAGPNPAELRAAYIEQLRAWGLSPGMGGLDGLISRAVNGTWGMARFRMAVRGTSIYHQMFRGIRWKAGMSEEQYINYYEQYSQQAKGVLGKYGKRFDREHFAKLLKEGVELSEWLVRLDAAEKMIENRSAINAYEQVLKARGMLKDNKNLKKKQIFDIITGQGDREFEKVWTEAYTTWQLEDAGIEVGKGGDISQGLVRKLSKDEQKAFSVDYAAVAQQVATVLPLSRIGKYGLTAKDLLKYQLGTPEQQQRVAQRIDLILQNEEAFRGYVAPRTQLSATGPQAQGAVKRMQRATY